MRNYYVLSNGRIRRDQNTIFIDNEATGVKKPIPVEDVDSLYLFGEVDLNTRLLNFLTQKHITLHVFNYYGYYAGSYYPREYLNSGYLMVHQVGAYADSDRRLALAKEIVRGAAHSLGKTLGYYARRKPGDDAEPPGEVGIDAGPNSGVPTDEEQELVVDAAAGLPVSADLVDSAPIDAPAGPLGEIQATIAALAKAIDRTVDITELMGVEGKMRERYFEGWSSILRDDWSFERRVRRPPDNEINALISFGNSILYTVCVSEIYRTQLAPTISYLHEPGARRFSLALDLSEMFKPLIVDRTIFRLINNRQLAKSHFDKTMDGCIMTDDGKKLYLQALNDRLLTTIKHRRLGRHVTYRHLIRLECYKLIRHLTEIEEYRAFRAWW